MFDDCFFIAFDSIDDRARSVSTDRAAFDSEDQARSVNTYRAAFDSGIARARSVNTNRAAFDSDVEKSSQSRPATALPSSRALLHASCGSWPLRGTPHEVV